MNSELSRKPTRQRLLIGNYLRVLLALGVAMLSGCAAFHGYPERPVDLTYDYSSISDDISAAKMTECFAKDGNEAIACRNKFISARMYATDIRFSEFEERLFRQTRESGFAATLSTLGLTSAAAFTSGSGSQVLSGIAAFIIGGREAFQKEVLAERTIIAIHTAMRANRAQIRLRILLGLRQSIETYPLALALANVNEYYDAGTILGALIGITETIGAQAKIADEKLLELTPLSKESFGVQATALRQDILKKISSLTDTEVTALIAKPPTPMNDDMNIRASGIDPSGQQRLTNPKAARAILRAWISHAVKVDDYPTWARAMGIVP